ncbi:hypothetical protein Nepgr_003467 [Nepenthes gracilis]|uniref:RING-type domain-containing protein n=1 Tax=Nepenthes gracilis TaxID=150966 RepID=A0AAD3RZK0_NEPGR|nr:hypothetical protein Nepgr_003467 [Nepenthes gracilis]
MLLSLSHSHGENGCLDPSLISFAFGRVSAKRNEALAAKIVRRIKIPSSIELEDFQVPRGLDQVLVDALPVFQYKEILGLKEPFDCAVCLCEFTGQDNLRLLPLCSHAFHIDCIDTWLLSNSTCPLCRGSLYDPGLLIENPVFNFEDSREEEDVITRDGGGGSIIGKKPAEIVITVEKKVFPVRLGKFRSSNDEGQGRGRDVGETSSSNLDARRCYSMGSYKYVVADSELQVVLRPNRAAPANLKEGSGQNGNSLNHRASDDRRIKIGGKNESFSVSKIWLWSKKDEFLSTSNTHIDLTSVDMSLPWTNRA